jgi:hypothetical protein
VKCFRHVRFRSHSFALKLLILRVPLPILIYTIPSHGLVIDPLLAIMSHTPPSRIRLPPHPSTGGFSDNAIDLSPSASTLSRRSPSYFSNSVPPPRRSARQSFATLRTRRGSRGTVLVHDDVEDIKLPTLVPGIRPAYSTPLPGLPMAVLSIVIPSTVLVGGADV